MYEGMQALAHTGQWVLTPPNPGVFDLYSTVTLSANVSGTAVRLERVGGFQMFTTRAALEPALPFHFAVTIEGFLGKLKHLVGFHDIAVGDPAFDKAFRVVSKDVDGVKAVLIPPVRAAITHLVSANNPFPINGFTVSEGGVSVTRTTGPIVMQARELVADVDNAVAVVAALRAARG